MKGYIETLKKYHRRGVYDGFQAATLVMLLAFSNIASDYVDDAQCAAMAKGLEAELNRILTQEFSRDPMEIYERAEYYVSQIREKYGMESLLCEEAV